MRIKEDMMKGHYVFKQCLSVLLAFVMVLGMGTPNMARARETEKAAIGDGIYTIPVNLWKAASDAPSMGNAGIEHTATLKVENGEGTLTLTMKKLSFSGLEGYLSQLNVMSDITFNENGYPIDYRKVPAIVLSTYDTVDNYNNESSTDENCRGRLYPKELSIPVTVGEEYTWVHMYVPIMGSFGAGDQEARIKLDYENAVKEESENEQNKTAQEEKQQDEEEPGENQETKEQDTENQNQQGQQNNNEKESENAVAEYTLKDGNYNTTVQFRKVAIEETSMANSIIKSAQLQVKSNKTTVILETQPLVVFGQTAYIQGLQYLDSGEYKEAQVTKMDNEKHIMELTFTLSKNVNYTDIKLNSGRWQEARLYIDFANAIEKKEAGISLDKSSIDLVKTEEAVIKAIVTGDSDKVVWSSENQTIASVTQAGVVTAKKAGVTTIKAEANGVTASCVVIVKEKTADINQGLEDGTYQVSVSLWHAYKDQPSMGNAALGQSGKLVIQNGMGTLYVNLSALSFQGKTGYLSEITPAEIIGYYNVVDQFNGKNSTDERCKGKNYPKRIAISVLPKEEYTNVHVYVPVMGSLGAGNQEARLKINYSSIRKISSSILTETADSSNSTIKEETSSTTDTKQELVIKQPTDEKENEESKENNKTTDSPSNKIDLNGFQKKGDEKYYYVNGKKVISKLIKSDGKKYYFDKNGKMVTSKMVTYKNEKYYVGKNGVAVTSKVVTYKGNRYYFNKSGKMITSKIVTYKENKYYAQKNGKLAVSKWVTVKGIKYYFDKSGKLIKQK
ncbi:hypothetical protein FYJ58_06645 [Lachnospiraceae bacterium WCA-693-APC-MOT-I]|uniref:NEAT domain-containing protein n=2 Tax=Velocimicrobium porci TaxID=2606634 RepID=A0A6L5XXR3_9FIRM|nr:hypothetical protein [Velocimicrobium porci]